MIHDVYPLASAAMSTRRKALAPDTHDAFTAFSQQVFADGEQVLLERVAELERALAVAEARADGAARLATERVARIDDLRTSLRMLEAAPWWPADGPPRRRWWWR